MGFPDNWENLPEWKTPSTLPRHVIEKKRKELSVELKRNKKQVLTVLRAKKITP